MNRLQHMNAYDFLQLCTNDPFNFTVFLFAGFSKHKIGSIELHRIFKYEIETNPFIVQSSLEKARRMFEKMQRIRLVLAKKARRCRASYLRERSFTNTDLNLEPIETHPLKHRIVLSNQGRPYEFFIGDLLKHWKSQLLTQEWRRASPVFPTNPYTNEKVSVLQFLRVYAVAMHVGFRLHEVLTMLYKHGGDLEEASAFGAVALNEWATQNYPAEGDVDELYAELRAIKNAEGNHLSNVALSEDPPEEVKQKIVDRLMPVLVAYSMWAYSINPEAQAILCGRFFKTVASVNAQLAGSRFGRVIKRRVNGRWVSEWLI